MKMCVSETYFVEKEFDNKTRPLKILNFKKPFVGKVSITFKVQGEQVVASINVDGVEYVG